jgi:uncharacterized iron-regulated membrane protein
LIEFNDAEKVRSYAWVIPYTGDVFVVIARDETAMRVVKRIHGELTLGDVGTKFVGMIVPPIGLALLLPLMEASLVLAPFHTIG